MKQVTLRLRDGRVDVVDVPWPSLTPEGVLIDVRASVLSVGTERSRVEASRSSLIGKARARPDQARQVIDKARRDGVRETVQTVRARLDQPGAVGYSAAGVVLDVGERVRGIAPGQRVACGGGDHAVHADVVQVPGNLCVPLPDDVDFDSAAFATIGSVAMHGVRQADVRIGERVAVIGLGLVGQLTGQILRAAGCRVVGIDLSPDLLAKGVEIGSIDLGLERNAFDGDAIPSGTADCDAVIVTAATRSNDPVTLAARLLRDRGRVVIVGDVHVDVPRPPYFEREIDIRFSRSYGPGRYDREYEERGLDYPIGYVRWTEQRNMASFVDLLGTKRIDVSGLVLERVGVDNAPDAYERLVTAGSSPLGVVLQYDPSASTAASDRSRVNGQRVSPPTTTGEPVVNVIGAGSFAQRILIPGLQHAGFALGVVSSAKGLTANAAADRFGFVRAVTVEEALTDPAADLVAIATRHATHASLAESALRGGRAVFVEKPPCLTGEELTALRAARAESGQLLAVGFNRRWAPLAVRLREHVQATGAPMELVYRINAGALPPGHWLSDPADGGGRLVGEGCHFVDFACWMAGELPDKVSCVLRRSPDAQPAAAPSFSIALGFPGGSLATILYSASGSPRLGKEYVEAHAGGLTGVLDDFKELVLQGPKGRTRARDKGDKGHRAQFRAVKELVAGGTVTVEPDPLDTMAVTLRALSAGIAA
jgi:predicted dehydrogenase/threonine dehydrogenase-like Zn-dependent dehydrogenase